MLRQIAVPQYRFLRVKNEFGSLSATVEAYSLSHQLPHPTGGIPVAIVCEKLDDVSKRAPRNSHRVDANPKLVLLLNLPSFQLRLSLERRYAFLFSRDPTRRELVTVMFTLAWNVSYSVNNQEKKLPFVALVQPARYVQQVQKHRSTEDWHIPTTQQQQIYSQDVRARVKSALETLCAQKKHWDLADLGIICAVECNIVSTEAKKVGPAPGAAVSH